MLRNLAKHSKPVQFPIKRIPCPLKVAWAVPTHCRTNSVPYRLQPQHSGTVDRDWLATDSAKGEGYQNVEAARQWVSMTEDLIKATQVFHSRGQ
jgi:hypothetical protein